MRASITSVSSRRCGRAGPRLAVGALRGFLTLGSPAGASVAMGSSMADMFSGVDGPLAGVVDASGASAFF